MARLAGFFIAFSLTLCVSPVSGAHVYMDSVKANLLIESQRYLFNDDFAPADSLARVFAANYPGDPGFWLMRSAIMMAEMYHAEDEIYDSTYKAAIDSLENGAAKVLDTSTDQTTRAWMYMWRGSAKAYKSLWEAKFGGTLAAVKLGFAARSECEKGLACDSDVVDLYVGLGTYHYWKSAKAGFLRWIGIFKNEKDKGIRELYRTVAEGTISRETAESGLIWIWLDMKQYDSTVVLARRMATQYPRGKSFYWPMGTAYYEQERYAEASAAFLQLRTMLDGHPGNYYNWIACDSWLAKCYEAMDRHDDARLVARRFSAYKSQVPGKTRGRQRSQINFLQKLAEQ